MKQFKNLYISLLLALPLLHGCGQKDYTVQSPDTRISVAFEMLEGGSPAYRVYHSDSLVIQRSDLGIIREDEDFSENLTLDSVSAPVKVSDSYTLLHGKKRRCTYHGTRRIFHLSSADGKEMNIIFQVSNDGLAYRYHFPGPGDTVFKIKREVSSFNLDTTAVAYLQPCPNPRTGWENTQPSYEKYYQGPLAVGKSAPQEAGWVMPALFKSGGFWIHLTETAVDTNYCGSRLNQHAPGGEYTLLFPLPVEARDGEPALPESTLPWSTPWRIVVVTDNLADLAESTLGTDLALPAQYDASSWFDPGKASWSWIMKKDGSINYDTQKEYIDFAASMNWRYCLVDVNWDRRIGYESMKQLADYAATKDVKLLLWYNSGGNWNTVDFYTPRNRLLTHESRTKEFQRLKEMGIAGIKVDFFGGDGQSMMKYYIDILKDAAQYELAVNFHGSTYPRGWSRTYPNLVTMEAVRGEEFVTFNQEDADRQSAHCTFLPFTRNLFDPMDYTPVNFSGIPTWVERRTTKGFEAALGVIFTSGIQHIAESPEGMARQPVYIKHYMRELPDTWDDTRFIDGYPGKYVILARQKDDTWYIAGINGEEKTRTANLKLPFLKEAKGVLITDSSQTKYSTKRDMNFSKPVSVKMYPHGGFVIKTAPSNGQ